MGKFNILDGIRIIDLGFEKAAYCTKILADLGAEVIKVEPLEGSIERRTPPFEENIDTENSVYFQFYNRGKKFVTLDITHNMGREIFRELVKKSDVLVEAFNPGYLENLSIGYGNLWELNKSLIYTAVTGYGQTGLKKNYQITDLVAFAAGGLMQLSGDPSKPPVKAPGQQAFDMAGLHAAIAILMALWEREGSGKGQFIDISMQEVMAAMEHNIAIYSKEKRIVKRVGSQHQVAVPGKVFRCKDGYVHMFIADASPKAWDSFLDWIGHPEELKDEKWRNGVYRRKNVAYVDEIVEEFTKKQAKNKLTAEAQKRHIPCVPVNTLEDLLEDEHFEARQFFVRDLNNLDLRFPMIFSELKEESITNNVLKLGANNNEVFSQVLGYDAQTLEIMAMSKVI